MAAPPEVNLANLTGNWVLNRGMANDPDPMLEFQGVPWLKRKIILLATVTLSVKEYIDDKDTTHIDLDQTATGGIQGTRELRTLDWSETIHRDHIFGTLKSRNRWVSDLKTCESGNGGPLDQYLTEGWLDEKVGPNGEGFVQNWVINEERGWTAEQIWGFTTIKGQRYKARKIVVQKGDQRLTVTLAYDWKGKLKV
ncbi:hypothetical protein AYO21_02487 [Fonsecaea monophora]|uniref:Lipocalin-like domain-containing protein n=1 Tax=Fonsecaea monophora TaxID=254056 RepID=A0A177FHJ1_9EURO|nr:hypothetical protein AYO21_02487 [Fonsecaea monophora]OAG43201.1 hypothetical protein AYO21_02487 [Fonsecaea monophora]